MMMVVYCPLCKVGDSMLLPSDPEAKGREGVCRNCKRVRPDHASKVEFEYEGTAPSLNYQKHQFGGHFAAVLTKAVPGMLNDHVPRKWRITVEAWPTQEECK